VRYSYSVTGLSGALDDQFDELSALREARGRGANAAQVSARAEQDEQLAEQLLRADGYYDAVATTTIAPVPDQPDHLTVTITATPGPRYMLGDIRITGAAPEPAGIARDALGLDSGDPIVAARVEAGEANVSLRLPQQGYPFVEVGARDILLDEATRRGDYTLPITSGPKAVFGGFRVEGDPVFDPDHIDLLARFRPGQLYDSRRVEDLKQAMIATALFSNVAVEPVRTGATTEDGLERVDLAVTQTEGPARQLAASAGYGTGQGIKLTGSWTHRNLFPPEGAVMVAAVAGTQEQSLSGTFRRSNAGRRDRAFQAGASIGRQNFDAFNAYTVGLNASIARVSTPLWQKRWTYTLGAEVLASAETRFVEARQARTRNTYFIAALPGQVGYDRSDSLLDPTRGFRLSARISPEAQQQGGRSDFYARTLFEASGYYPVTDALVIAGRTRVGSILGAPRDRIAPSRRLDAGGGGSVRGFGFQELGPKDIDNKPIGGRSLTEFAIEARYRFGDFGIVPFFDAGRVGEGSTPGISDLRYGAGIGGRYYTNFGPMRVDIAMPLGRRPGESKVALYISIGQAF
jgi:translocation and assembly module TamA